jgi:hypothetical protein
VELPPATGSSEPLAAGGRSAVGRRERRRRRAVLLARMNLLELVPVRTARWEERDTRVVLTRPRPDAGIRRRRPGWLVDRLVGWLGYALAPARLRLDDLGSATWRRLDGAATVGEVASAVREVFGEAAEPAEERVGTFVRLLHRDGFLALPAMEEGGPEDAR